MMRGHGRSFLWVSVGTLLVLGLCQAAGGQVASTAAEAVPTGALSATVRMVDSQAEQINLSVGKSAVIESAEPITAASVINPEIVEVTVVSPHVIMVRGKSYGTTQVVLIAGDGRRRAYIAAVGMDVTQMEAAIRAATPCAEIRVSSILDTVILAGVVPDAETAAQVAQIAGIFSPKVQNHLRVAGTQQVLLRCTVAEVSRSAVRQLGFNGYAYGKDFFGVNQINQIQPVNIGSPAGVNVENGGPVIAGADGKSIVPTRFTFNSPVSVGSASTIYFGLPRAQMEMFVQAMAQNGLLKVLAEPNLVATSGQTANFLAGGEFPIPVPQGLNTVTIEWKRFGVQLDFTPAVLPGQRIRLKVAPSVSELDYSNAVQMGGFVVPGLTERHAETTVEVGNGQTFVVAGLLSESSRGATNRVPGLGDVPVLGALFRSVEYRKNQTELMILVTPELVAPMDPQQVPPMPGQNITDPNDFELYGLAMLQGKPAASLHAASSQPTGTPAVTAGLYGAWGPADVEGQ
jgi:pilus assembly protein CpaC